MERLPHAFLSSSGTRIGKILGEGAKHGHEKFALGPRTGDLLDDGDVGHVMLGEDVESVQHYP